MIAQIDESYIRARPWKLWGRLLGYALFEGRPLTTRGQWINPFIFAHFALEKRLPPLRRVERPVFIIGTGRSGTTILGIVLSMHREVGFLNEPKALWHAIHPHEDLIGSYSRSPARYRLRAEEATPELTRVAYRLFGAYLAATCSRRLVDKYPELIFRVPFVKAMFPDAQFLFLVRSGWDTCHSIEGWSDRLGQTVSGEVHDWWGADRRKWNLLVEQIVPEHADLAEHAALMRTWSNHSDMAALEWIVTMREGLELQGRYPQDLLTVNYERLCRDPRQVMGEIGNFLGLGQDETFMGYGQQVLRPVKAKPPFRLDPAIGPQFLETMRRLGYEER